MKKETSINLQDFRTPGSRVFTGRDRGVEVRTNSHIDEIETQFERISIIIPEDIGSINPSFLEEFLFNVVTKLKKENFTRKFSFISNGRYKIESDLDEAIDRILRTDNALTR
jgi:hypothetical protein